MSPFYFIMSVIGIAGFGWTLISMVIRIGRLEQTVEGLEKDVARLLDR